MEVRFLTIALPLHALTGAHQWPDQSQEKILAEAVISPHDSPECSRVPLRSRLGQGNRESPVQRKLRARSRTRVWRSCLARVSHVAVRISRRTAPLPSASRCQLQ